MRQHLYVRKTSCADINGLELTEQIKEQVMNARRYHPPKKSDKGSNATYNIINQYNTINNFVCGLGFDEKMGLLLDYQKGRLLDIEDGLDDRFQQRVQRLEDDKYRSGCYLSLDDLFGLVNDVTKIDKDNIQKFNILFDKAVKRFKLYRCKTWESFLEDMGARELVSLIKSYYLDTYEIYLIRNLYTEKSINLNRIKLNEHLEIYYRFISIFELPAFITNFSDQEVLGHRLVEGNEDYLAEKYLQLYCEQKKQLKPTEINRIKRKIINIVKENTVHNLAELNKAVLEILKVDENFRNELLRTRTIDPEQIAEIKEINDAS
jgi:hypothetical protein